MSNELSYDDLKIMYDEAPCGYHSLDEKGVIIHINKTELRWMGLNKQDVVGKLKFTDVIDEKSIQLFKKMFPIFLRQGSIEGLEFNIINRETGIITPILVSAKAVKNEAGNLLYSNSVLLDMTTYKEIEHLKEVKELNEFFVGRELKMRELKEENDRSKKQCEK